MSSKNNKGHKNFNKILSKRAKRFRKQTREIEEKILKGRLRSFDEES